MSECKICRGHKVVLEDGIRVPCKCLVEERISIFFRPLGEWERNLPEDEVEAMANSGLGPNFILKVSPRAPQAAVRGWIAALIVRDPKTFDAIRAHAIYDIIEGNHGVYSSLSSVNVPRLVVFYGYGKGVPRMLTEGFMRLLDNRKDKGLETWFIVSGELDDPLYDACVSYDFDELNVRHWTDGGEEEGAEEGEEPARRRKSRNVNYNQ